MAIQDTIDALIVYIDEAVAVHSVSNHHVATVLDYLNQQIKALAIRDDEMMEELLPSLIKVTDMDELAEESKVYESGIYRVKVSADVDFTIGFLFTDLVFNEQTSTYRPHQLLFSEYAADEQTGDLSRTASAHLIERYMVTYSGPDHLTVRRWQRWWPTLSSVSVDTELDAESGNAIANSVVASELENIYSMLQDITGDYSGFQLKSNIQTSIGDAADDNHYPSSLAVKQHVLLEKQRAVAKEGQLEQQIGQNQSAINGLDNVLSSLANRVTSAEDALDGMGIDGDEVYIGNHTVNVRDFVLGYYIKGYKNTMNLSFGTLTGTNSLSFNLGSQHYDLVSGTAVSLVEQITAILAGLGYSPSALQSGSTSWKIEFLSDSSVGIVQKTGGDQYTTISLTSVGAEEGFYSDSGFHTPIQGSVGKLYIDLGTNMLYRFISGTTYQPMNAQPFTSGSYNATTQSLVFNFAGGSISVPIGDMLPEFTAGKGISIVGGVVSQNYLVVNQDEIEDYLAHGTEDGVVRYVYEED